MNQKRALITGVTGQDGAYLARLLVDKGYEVFGTSRDAQMSSFSNLTKLSMFDNVTKLSMMPTDFRSVLQTLKITEPDEIYHLAGQSSVGLSFGQPVETLDSIAFGTLNLLEAIRFTERDIKLYNASSSECFGDIGDAVADENTPFRPRSPYAVAKAASHWEVINYRDAYGLFACNGILFNHESPLRSGRFVTKKIIDSVRKIKEGTLKELTLGNIEIIRDWGWAPEYVEAMWLMLQQNEPDDFIIATGKSHKLLDFINEAFKCAELQWNQHVVLDESLKRPSDLAVSRANPSKANKLLGWKAKKQLEDIVKYMYHGTLY